MKRIPSILAIALIATLPAAITRAQSPSPSAKSSASASSSSSSTSTTTSGASSASGSPASGSATAASPSGHAAKTDVYHVHFTHATPGKATELAESLKRPSPDSPMPGHVVMFRHQDGDAWDYCVIEHLGTKATVDAARTPPAPAARDLSDWHTDTFVSGPPWSEFSKAMGIGEGAPKSAVYIVSMNRAVPGHREQLEAVLTTQSPGDPAAGNVVMQHMEGAAWTFVAVTRYASWEDFVKGETSSAADQAKGASDWAKMREHSAYHTDTIADRILP